MQSLFEITITSFQDENCDHQFKLFCLFVNVVCLHISSIFRGKSKYSVLFSYESISNWFENWLKWKLVETTRRFSNHESRLLSRSHTFAIIVIFNRFENTSKYVDTLTLFSKNMNQRSLTPRWPLTPCLLRSHVWLYPRIIVSKSHDDTSMYVDTVINFANYHIHTYTYYVHTTYYVQNEWSHSLLLNSVQARQKLVQCIF